MMPSPDSKPRSAESKLGKPRYPCPQTPEVALRIASSLTDANVLPSVTDYLVSAASLRNVVVLQNTAKGRPPSSRPFRTMLYRQVPDDAWITVRLIRIIR